MQYLSSIQMSQFVGTFLNILVPFSNIVMGHVIKWFTASELALYLGKVNLILNNKYA